MARALKRPAAALSGGAEATVAAKVARKALSRPSAPLSAGLLDLEWKEALQSAFDAEAFRSIESFVASERERGVVHPPEDLVWSAFNETPLGKVKVVILGQDPYHEPGQAHGMCFSVRPGVKPPPSLKNMYKELATDIPGFVTPDHGYLLPWAKQGVLLLNATLTVREGHKEANSHAKCGWLGFTDQVIKILNERPQPVVFLLWGGFAKKKGKIIDRKKHTVIESAHPSPLSAKKWFGCKTFSKCNSALRSLGLDEIDWALPPLQAENIE
uniref:Uracil-DNA glycosylase n=1 Tax=Crypthecodinium cohnii TaxID=2866 RepID=A0A516AGW4_CRYCO|nr:uracil-DNA glycosylase [Crypthecodinium cohnii]USW07802.1 uracil-DNA glycosylase [Crypthecodinium cohnii]